MRAILFLVAFALGALCCAVLLATAAVHAKPHPWPDKALQRCYVFLPDMRSERTKKWCLKQSERMP